MNGGNYATGVNFHVAYGWFMSILSWSFCSGNNALDMTENFGGKRNFSFYCGNDFLAEKLQQKLTDCSKPTFYYTLLHIITYY